LIAILRAYFDLGRLSDEDFEAALIPCGSPCRPFPALPELEDAAILVILVKIPNVLLELSIACTTIAS